MGDLRLSGKGFESVRQLTEKILESYNELRLIREEAEELFDESETIRHLSLTAEKIRDRIVSQISNVHRGDEDKLLIDAQDCFLLLYGATLLLWDEQCFWQSIKNKTGNKNLSITTKNDQPLVIWSWVQAHRIYQKIKGAPVKNTVIEEKWHQMIADLASRHPISEEDYTHALLKMRPSDVAVAMLKEGLVRGITILKGVLASITR